MSLKNKIKLMDNQGHKKDISSNQDTPKLPDANAYNQSPIDYFSQNQSFVFVYKKTEKLATALYMVTNLFGDNEPMKWTLRTKVSHLLSYIIGFKDILESREYEFSNDVKTKVLEVVSLLEVASRSGLVSPMNFSILKGEFMNLLSSLSALKKEQQEGTHFAFSKNFFEVPHKSPQRVGSSPDSHDAFATESSKGHTHTVKDNTSFKEDVSEGTSFKKTNRQSIIINLLKKKKDLTIKDIAMVIRDCSEKTIQRELIALIDAGVLKKTGERRWSRYSLVQA
jgi:hypothetical protein